MTNSDVIEIAMAQSAIDSNCRKEDFNSNENKVVISAKNSNRQLTPPLNQWKSCFILFQEWRNIYGNKIYRG